MKKFIIISMMTILFPSVASGWGSATHTYIAHEIGNSCGLLDCNEMYGSVVPDFPNLMIGSPYQDYLWTETHYDFMKVVYQATTRYKRAFAYGFASHSETPVGADYTAHIEAITIPGGEGYVVVKAGILAPQIAPAIEAFCIAKGIPYTPGLLDTLSLKIADTSIESAVDYLISLNESPAVGIQMYMSALFRSYFVPSAMMSAYARDLAENAGIGLFEAMSIIYQAERAFRQYMVLYGSILTQPNAIDLMAEQGAELGSLILAQYGINIDISPELVLLLKQCLLSAIDEVDDSYSLEIAATIENVEINLEAAGIKTYIPWYALSKPAVASEGPVAFSLGQNYPNPFNATTTIDYSIPYDGHAMLSVYNITGQRIDVLKDEYHHAGRYTVTWDASGLPSGVYLYVLKAGTLNKTLRMTLVK